MTLGDLTLDFGHTIQLLFEPRKRKLRSRLFLAERMALRSIAQRQNNMLKNIILYKQRPECSKVALSLNCLLFCSLTLY